MVISWCKSYRYHVAIMSLDNNLTMKLCTERYRECLTTKSGVLVFAQAAGELFYGTREQLIQSKHDLIFQNKTKEENLIRNKVVFFKEKWLLIIWIKLTFHQNNVFSHIL